MTIWPTARVTISGLSLSPPIRIPFSRPITGGDADGGEIGDPDPLIGLLADPDHQQAAEQEGAGDAEVDATGHDHQHLAEGGDGEEGPHGGDGF